MFNKYPEHDDIQLSDLKREVHRLGRNMYNETTQIYMAKAFYLLALMVLYMLEKYENKENETNE